MAPMPNAHSMEILFVCRHCFEEFCFVKDFRQEFTMKWTGRVCIDFYCIIYVVIKADIHIFKLVLIDVFA